MPTLIEELMHAVEPTLGRLRKLPEIEYLQPNDIAELLARVYPDGASEAVTQFFNGVELAEEDCKLLMREIAELKSQASKGVDEAKASLEYWAPYLIRYRSEYDSFMTAFTPARLLGCPPRELGMELGTKAGHEKRIQLLEETLTAANQVREFHVPRERDFGLLELLASAIANGKDIGDAYFPLLPASTIKRIQDQRWYAEYRRQTEEAARQRQAEQEVKSVQERLAAIETADVDGLLNALFADSAPWELRELPDALRNRTLTPAQYQKLADRRHDFDDPVRARACALLIEVGAEILKEIALRPAPPPPTDEELAIERERQIQAYLASLDTMHFDGIVEEANKIGLISPTLYGRLNAPNMDTETRTAIAQHVREQLTQETDIIRRGMLERLLQKFSGVGYHTMGAGMSVSE
ncbi:MAG TPA: hypothetical protein VJ810_23610 [Blastocatellia bacterium]|nr:hypothetical protein [Blastocatellia bacterium]